MTGRATAVLLCLTCAGAPAAFGQPASPLAAVVDSFAAGVLQRYDIAGMQVAVAGPGGVVLSRGYGRTRADGGPVGTRTTFAFASLTKPFTAALVMREARARGLSLDAPLAAWSGDVPPVYAAVTMAQLLAHQAGLPVLDGLQPAPARDRTSPAGRAAYLAWLRTTPPAFVAGTQARYSNAAYLLAGLLLGPTPDTWDARVAALGRDAGVAVGRCTPRGTGDTAAGHARGAFGVAPVAPMPDSLTTSGGGLCGTAEDLVRFATALPRLLGPDDLRRARTPTVTAAGAETGWAPGWEIDHFEGHRRMLHSGNLPGFQGAAAYFPDDGVAVAVLANTSGGIPMGRILERLASYALGLVPLGVVDTPLAAEVLPTFVGRYYAEGDTLRVVAESGRLWLRGLPNSPPVRLIPFGGAEFRTGFDLLNPVVFNVPAAGGPATGFTLRQRARRLTAVRLGGVR